GGSAAAAPAGDWVVSLPARNAFVRASSRFADAVETVTLDWLRQLVGLPAGWGGVRHAGRAVPAGPGRPPGRLRPARPGVLAAGARPADLGHARRVRPHRLPGTGGAPLRPGRPPCRDRRRGAGPRTPGRGPPQRGLLPLPP